MWPFKSKEDKQHIEESRRSFDAFVSAAASATPEAATSLARGFEMDELTEHLSEREQRERASAAFLTYAESVLADDHLTADEEAAFGAVGTALRISHEELQTKHGDVLSRLMVAKLNNGRLEAMTDHQLMAKAGESVYLEIGAALLKEVTLREWQGASGGVSFRIVKGVRYNTGRTRGRSVVVGTELQIADVGLLAVSSKRIAFMGERKSMEFPLSKLMNLDMFEDGVRIHSSNRQNAPVFQLQANTADVFAATVNAVAQLES